MGSPPGRFPWEIPATRQGQLWTPKGLPIAVPNLPPGPLYQTPNLVQTGLVAAQLWYLHQNLKRQIHPRFLGGCFTPVS